MATATVALCWEYKHPSFNKGIAVCSNEVVTFRAVMTHTLALFHRCIFAGSDARCFRVSLMDVSLVWGDLLRYYMRYLPFGDH
jgi:hypothetical protein